MPSHSCRASEAQGTASGPHGTVDVIKVHGVSLEGNLESDPTDRQVSIYLPPSYQRERARRYPVIYLLHGYTDTDDRWFRRVQHLSTFRPLPIARGRPGCEMMIVMPNAYTRYQGHVFGLTRDRRLGEFHCPRAGRVRRFTLSNDSEPRLSRGLAGHSMGGYGTLRVGMKHPDVASIYTR
jgi:S-formylglutathione hydrolase FrmB